MSEPWRVIDSGLQPAAQNIALSRAMLEARQADEIPSTLRFLRYTPSATVGFHQSADQEFHLDYCNAQGIAVQRRISACVASYSDAAQFDWEVYVHRRELANCDVRAAARRIGHVVATAISAFGVDANIRYTQEIEVDGRVLCATGSICDREAMLLHGTVWLDLQVERVCQIMRLPCGSDPAAGAELGERIATLRELAGRPIDRGLFKRYLIEAFESEFGTELREGDLDLSEHERYRTAFAAIGSQDWIELMKAPVSDFPVYEAHHCGRGGAIGAKLIYDRPRHRIRQVWFHTDARIEPGRCLRDLEAMLRETSVERLDHNVRRFFSDRRTVCSSLSADDFIAVTRLAAKQPLLAPNR